MIKSGFTPCLSVVRPKFQFLVRSKFVFGLIIVALSGVLTASAAQGDQPNPDEQYIHIMATIDKADALRTAGQIPAAVARYREAQTNLVRFKAYNPLFNPKTVQYRITEVSDRIAALTAPPERPASKTNSESQPVVSAPKSIVKLVDAGAEPRKVLRFHGQPGDKQTTLMIMKSTVDMGTQGQPPVVTPAVTLPLDITTKGVSPNGDITYEIVLGDVNVAEDTNATPQAAQGMKTIMSSIKGVTITGVMSDRGISKKTDVKAPPGSSPQVQQAVEQLKEGFSNMDSPLPEEAVGAGAKWEINRPTKAQGMSGQQTESYQLVSVDGDHVNMSMNLNVTVTNQVMQSVATTTGTNTMDLTKIAPLSASWTSHMDLNASGPKPMAMKTDTSFEMESK